MHAAISRCTSRGVRRCRRWRGVAPPRQPPEEKNTTIGFYIYIFQTLFFSFPAFFFPERSEDNDAGSRRRARARRDTKGSATCGGFVRACTHHVGKVHAHGHVAVAAVVLETIAAEEERDERDVGGVHRLKGEAVLGAVEVGIGDEVLDGLEHLLQERTLDETRLKHCAGVCWLLVVVRVLAVRLPVREPVF